MFLYLTTNAKSTIIDGATKDSEMAIKKLTGNFNINNFVTKDMRNYVTAHYVAIDYSCVEDTLDDFILALQSFQMMFSARIIIILSGCESTDDLVKKLVSVGVINLVTADTVDGVTNELIECLSDEGMQKYISPSSKLLLPKANLIPQYAWSASNVKIAVMGTQRRSGVTVTAFNMAEWLTARGASVCYVEMNQTKLLQILLGIYDAQLHNNCASLDGIDCYLTNSLQKDYNFIIYDCGTDEHENFKNADMRILCGSMLPYEIPAFHSVLSSLNERSVCNVALSIPQELTGYCTALFGEDLRIADISHSLFASNINEHIYYPLIEPYILEDKSWRNLNT